MSVEGGEGERLAQDGGVAGVRTPALVRVPDHGGEHLLAGLGTATGVEPGGDHPPREHIGHVPLSASPLALVGVHQPASADDLVALVAEQRGEGRVDVDVDAVESTKAMPDDVCSNA